MNNKVFYQHPNLMRALGMHETVMEVMVNVLSGGDSKVYYMHMLQSQKIWIHFFWNWIIVTTEISFIYCSLVIVLIAM